MGNLYFLESLLLAIVHRPSGDRLLGSVGKLPEYTATTTGSDFDTYE